MRQHAVSSPDGAARMLTHGGSVAACTLRSPYGRSTVITLSGGRNRAGCRVPLNAGAEFQANYVLGSSQHTIADRSPSGPPGPLQFGRVESNVGPRRNRL